MIKLLIFGHNILTAGEQPLRFALTVVFCYTDLCKDTVIQAITIFFSYNFYKLFISNITFKPVMIKCFNLLCESDISGLLLIMQYQQLI